MLENISALSGIAFIAVPLALILFLIVSFLMFYKKCQPNELLVIYGKTGGKRSAKVVHGGGALVIPGLQDYTKLSLTPLDYDVDLKEALSSNNIRLNIPVSCTVAIGRTPELSQNAAERLLGLSLDEILGAAESITIGQLRAAVATLTIEEINQDRERFMETINVNIETELAKLGLEVINVNIRDITDQSGYIDAIGQKAASTAVNQAKIDVAEQEKAGAIGIEKANREREQTVAEQKAAADKKIAETEKDKESHVAEQIALQKEAVNLSKKKEAESDALLAVAKTNADKAASLALEKADKEIYEAKKDSELAKQRSIEVVNETIEAEKEIERANGVAKSIEIKAKAEAEAYLMKYKAEAEGIQLVMRAKAEGYKELQAALGGTQHIVQIEMVNKIVEITQLQTEAISKMKIDSINVWDGGSKGGNGEAGLKGFMKDFLTMGAPMNELAKTVGFELPTFLGQGIKNPEKVVNDIEHNAKEQVEIEEKKKSEKSTEQKK